MLTLRFALLALLGAAFAAPALANSFSATYAVQMSVDAGKALPPIFKAG